MWQLNETVRHYVTVTDLNGASVTGLVTANFTRSLTRWTGSAMVAATEAVTAEEIGSGAYWLEYAPATYTGQYVLAVSVAGCILSRELFEADIETGYASTAGPYLTTRTAVRLALGLAATDTGKDNAIDALIAQVSALCEGYCDRIFASRTHTEYRDGHDHDVLVLKQWPVASITSVHESTAAPRVFDSTTLLVADEDYVVDEEGLICRVDGSKFPRGPHTVKVVYVAGYSTIPADLERSVIEVSATKLYKTAVAGGPMYHLTGMNIGEGAITGIRFDDIPDDARRVWDRYRRVSL